MAKILKNQTLSPIFISDVGITIPILPLTYTIQPSDYLLWASSDDIITHIGSGNVIVNDGSFDLSKALGTSLLQGNSKKTLFDNTLLSSDRLKVEVTQVAAGPVIVVSANDTTPGFLEDKIVGQNMVVTTINEGANERIQIAPSSNLFNKTIDTASNVVNTPAGNIAATTVQNALNELDSEKQPIDATLTSLAAYNTSGLLTQTAPDTFTGRTLVAGSGIEITNANGVSGNPTISSTVSAYTDEQAQDAVGNLLTDSSSIDFTYNDAGDSLIAAVLPAGVNHDALQNFVANKHIDHSAVNITAGTGLSGGGDITSTRTLNIANTTVTAGSYGSATQSPSITVNAQGQITAAASNTITPVGIGAQPADADLTSLAALATTGMVARTAANTFTTRTVTASTGLTVTNGSGVAGDPIVAITNTAVTAGSYGSASSIPSITVNAQGQLTAASSNALIATNVTNTPTGNIGAVTVQAALNELDTEKQAISEKGQPNGYASLDGTGKVPSAQLPAFVEEVVEYATFAALPVTGVVSIIYVTLNNNKTYRWSGSAYVEISPSDVSAVFGRSGSVVAQSGDYTATQVTNSPSGNITATNLQTAVNQLDTIKQPLDSTLTSLASYNTNGILTQTTADTFTGRTLTAGIGISITNGDGVAANPTISSTINQYTNEDAQDAVGNILTDSASIDFTYNDIANTITAVVLPAGVDHNSLQNFVANKHIDHSTVSITAGTGLTGGGDITASRSLTIANTTVVAGSYGSASSVPSLTVNAQGQLTAAASNTISIPSTQINDFTEASQDAIGGALLDSSSVDFTYNDAANTITAVVLPAGVDHNSLLNFVANKHIDHSAVSITAGTGLTGGGDLTATRTVAIANTGVTAASYGSTTTSPSITVNAQGQITSASSTTITPAFSSITSKPTTLSGYGITDAVNNIAGTPSITSDIFANRPAFGAAGRVYISTDTNIIYRDTGTSWVVIGNSSTGTVSSIATGAGLIGGPITTTGTISMPNVGTAGSYGSATQIPVLTTDTQGRVSAVTNTAISIPSTQVNDFSEAVDDRVAALLVAGTNVILTYNDAGNTLTVASSGTSYTDEQAQDAVGNIMLDSSSIDFTYNDAANTITAAVLPAGVDHNSLQNYSANRHIDHSAISILAGNGLTGGGTLLTNQTLSMPNVGTVGTYGSSTQIPVITTDTQGRVSSVTLATVSGGLGLDAENFEDLTTATTTSTTFGTGATFTTTPKAASRYRIGLSFNWALNTSSSDARFRLMVDGVQLGSEMRSEPSETNSQSYWESAFMYITFGSAQTHTLTLEFAAEAAGNTVSLFQTRMEIWRA